MSTVFTLQKGKSKKADLVLLLTTIVLVGVGLGVLFSASSFVGQRLHDNPYSFFFGQLRWVVLGGVGAFVLSHIRLEKVRQFLPILLIVSFVMMILTFIPLFSRPLMGARRWIVVGGFSFQSSELLKFTLILYLAHMFSKPEQNLGDFWKGIFPSLVVISGALLLVLLQNDFSTMVFLALVCFSMFFIAGLQKRYILIFSTVSLPLGTLFLFMEEHRVQRAITFLNPFHDPSGAGYQILASLRALGEGGLWGKGFGAGVRKLGSIPEVQADFILSAMGEETGFMGVLALFGLFALLGVRGFLAGYQTKDPFRRYLAMGISTALILQFLFNAGVVVGALPSTGIPLPFFSAGGSSILISLLMVGILLNISRKEDPSDG